ncbi:hypothetical protein KY361_07380 [Candidatus Woesearchaeota archaeon]|nr:hypothetical protein [Candidatus Woesearchaeota archaeon]
MRDKITDLLKKLSSHPFIELTSRGNTAIFAALYCARKLQLGKKNILIPDQSGWFTYKKYPKMLGLNPIEVKTDYGIIDLDDLKKKSENANCLLYSTPAGYFAEQPVKEIYSVCKKNKCMVILDVSGSIGRHDYGAYCDFAVCSFGEWKPVNLGYGGFVSALEKEFFEKPKEIFNTTSFDEKYFPELIEKLKSLKKRYELFDRVNKKIKKGLKDFDILHKDSDGINVIVKFKDELEKDKIVKYCEKNKLEFTICPRYIRVKEKAVSIEVKRLE